MPNKYPTAAEKKRNSILLTPLIIVLIFGFFNAAVWFVLVRTIETMTGIVIMTSLQQLLFFIAVGSLSALALALFQD